MFWVDVVAVHRLGGLSADTSSGAGLRTSRLACRDGTQTPQKTSASRLGHGYVPVKKRYRCIPSTRERSLENWQLQITCFEKFFLEQNTLGLVPEFFVFIS